MIFLLNQILTDTWWSLINWLLNFPQSDGKRWKCDGGDKWQGDPSVAISLCSVRTLRAFNLFKESPKKQTVACIVSRVYTYSVSASVKLPQSGPHPFVQTPCGSSFNILSEQVEQHYKWRLSWHTLARAQGGWGDAASPEAKETTQFD